MTYGYARVSSRDQNEERQIISLTDAGVERKNIVVEKQSGKNFDRPLYIKLVRKLHEGDVLMVASIDRLGRNYDEILEWWRKITKEKNADIVVLDMPLLDTREEKGLTGRLISDIVLQLLSYVAQSERENIKKRQAEGIAAAKARGVRFGREKKPLPEGFHTAVKYVQLGQMTQTAAARSVGMVLSSFRTRCKLEGIELPRQQPAKPKPPKPKRVPHYSENYLWLKEHKICTICAKRKARPGKTSCCVCAERAREYRARKKQEMQS